MSQPKKTTVFQYQETVHRINKDMLTGAGNRDGFSQWKYTGAKDQYSAKRAILEFEIDQFATREGIAHAQRAGRGLK